MKVEMRPEEVCEKLKPIIGDKADKLRRLYLLEDYRGREQIAETINAQRVRYLNEEEILLPPPDNLNGDYPVGEVM